MIDNKMIHLSTQLVAGKAYTIEPIQKESYVVVVGHIPLVGVYIGESLRNEEHIVQICLTLCSSWTLHIRPSNTLYQTQKLLVTIILPSD